MVKTFEQDITSNDSLVKGRRIHITHENTFCVDVKTIIQCVPIRIVKGKRGKKKEVSGIFSTNILIECDEKADVKDQDTLQLYTDSLQKYFLDWWPLLKEEFEKDYWRVCWQRVMNSFLTEQVFPSLERIFYAFTTTLFANLKVVILGQDPYHGIGQAMGLAFSVPRDLKRLPPSLVNIYKEVVQDNTKKPMHGDLTCWATQGVLLLNSILSVRKGAPMSHKHYGWDIFTDNVLKIINENTTNTVFLLWGKPAQKKAAFIDSRKHCVLTAGHPSPLSWRHFRGCQHFSKTNEYLRSVGKKCVNWMQPWESNGT